MRLFALQEYSETHAIAGNFEYSTIEPLEVSSREILQIFSGDLPLGQPPRLCPGPNRGLTVRFTYNFAKN